MSGIAKLCEANGRPIYWLRGSFLMAVVEMRDDYEIHVWKTRTSIRRTGS